MPKRPVVWFSSILAIGLGAVAPGAVVSLAQAPSAPGLPPAPQPTGRLPQGSQGAGSGNYVVSAAANDRGSFLWVVDSVQHSVMLCEKGDAKDFTCTKKPLP